MFSVAKTKKEKRQEARKWCDTEAAKFQPQQQTKRADFTENSWKTLLETLNSKD